MALAATTILECRTDGSDDNGGGFNPSRSVNGVDRSQQAAAHVFIDGSTITATVHTTTSQITIVGYTVGNTDLGNLLNITGGTATAGIYEITAVDTVNNRWSLDRSAGTSTQTVIGRMGGAYGSPGKLAAIMSVSGMVGYIRGGTYTLTTSTVGAGGPLRTPQVSCSIRGYSTTRNDEGQPIISAGSVSAISVVSQTGGSQVVYYNLIADGNSQTSNNGFAGQSQDHRFINCEARNCPGTGFSGGVYYNCLANSCGTGLGASAFCCVAKNCSIGFLTASGFLVNCIAYGCTADGFRTGGNGSSYINCVAYGNTGDGFDAAQSGNVHGFYGCIAEGNTAFGFRGTISSFMVRCATYNNTSGRQNGSVREDILPITLTTSSFNNAAGYDFSLNNASGGGAALRNLNWGIPEQAVKMLVGAVQNYGQVVPKSPFNQEVIG